jgi:methylase of polypeptide subunit release factors
VVGVVEARTKAGSTAQESLVAEPDRRALLSGHAASYATFRPRHPNALFAALAARAPSRRRAWDCGTGNGQAAAGLAARFEQVLATDPSAEQPSHAIAAPRIVDRQRVA